VDGRALRQNLRAVRDPLPAAARVIPMVKADAYGLGVSRVVRALRPEGPWGWGVATVGEGIELRDEGVREPVVVFSPLTVEDTRRALKAELSVTVSSLDALAEVVEAAGRLADPAAFHLEIDTGMGRAGADRRGIADWIEPLRMGIESGALRWEGVFTHYHSADEAGGPGVQEQTERLRAALTALDAVGSGPEMVHRCNSAAVLRDPELAADAVRPGIFLYGGGIGPDLPAPRPVAALRARVVLLREAEAGDTVGYGATYTASGDERWATVSIGYGDGLPRSLSNRGRALVRGASVPIVGRISMDMTVVDISGVDDVEVGDAVTFFGNDGAEALRLDEVAATAGTISYEILTGVTPRVPRVWTHE